MKKCVLPVGILVALMVAPSFAAENKAKTIEYAVVQVTGHSGKTTNYVMIAQELNAVMKDAEAEAKVFKKAMQMAEADWKSNPSTKDRGFPKSAISPKKVKVLNKYTDQDKAVEKVAAAAQRLQDEADMVAKRRKEADDVLKLPPASIKEREKKANEQESHYNLARKIFEDKLKELLAGPTPTAASTNKPAGQTNAPAQKPIEEKK